MKSVIFCTLKHAKKTLACLIDLPSNIGQAFHHKINFKKKFRFPAYIAREPSHNAKCVILCLSSQKDKLIRKYRSIKENKGNCMR